MNSYTGGTVVSGGELVLTDAGAIADETSLTVGAGGTLIFDSAYPSAAPIHNSYAPAQINPVPEPGSLALLSIAVCGAAVYQRLRSQRRQQ